MTRHYWMGGNRSYGNRSYEQDRFFEESLDRSLWQKAENAEQWDACWYTGRPDPEFFSQVGPARKINHLPGNHLPGNNALTVKSRLYQSLMDLRERVTRQENGGKHLTDRLAFVPRVDCEARERNLSLETDRRAGGNRLSEILRKLRNRFGTGYSSELAMRHTTDGRRRLVNASLDRELAFLASHTIHHMAIIGMLAEQAGVEVSAEFGVHPSTLRHLQRQASAMARSA